VYIMRQAKCTPDALQEFFNHRPGATTADAARHFGISDRRIRQIKAAPVAVTQLVAPALDESRRARIVARPDVRYTSILFNPDALIDSALCRCPKCGELMRPQRGDTRGLWARVGCGECRMGLQQSVGAAIDAAETSSPAENPDAETSAEGNTGSMALESETSVSFLPAGELSPAQVSGAGNHELQRLAVAPTPRIVVRTIYRTPALFEVIPFHVALAIGVATLLIALCMWQVR
jgi:hypothetical protein